MPHRRYGVYESDKESEVCDSPIVDEERDEKRITWDFLSEFLNNGSWLLPVQTPSRFRDDGDISKDYEDIRVESSTSDTQQHGNASVIAVLRVVARTIADSVLRLIEFIFFTLGCTKTSKVVRFCVSKWKFSSRLKKTCNECRLFNILQLRKKRKHLREVFMGREHELLEAADEEVDSEAGEGGHQDPDATTSNRRLKRTKKEWLWCQDSEVFFKTTTATTTLPPFHYHCNVYQFKVDVEAPDD